MNIGLHLPFPPTPSLLQPPTPQLQQQSDPGGQRKQQETGDKLRYAETSHGSAKRTLNESHPIDRRACWRRHQSTPFDLAVVPTLYRQTPDVTPTSLPRHPLTPMRSPPRRP